MFWVIHYTPKDLNDLELYPELNERLKKIGESRKLNNLIFYGKPGSGKYTRAKCLLKEFFGEDVMKIRLIKRKILLKKSSIDLNVLCSNNHIELDLSENVNDHLIIYDIVKSIPDCNLTIILLKNAQNLSEKAQSVICNILDKNLKKCKFVFCCTKSIFSKKIFSYCDQIRVPSPSYEDVKKIINFVGKKENMKIPEIFLNDIITNSDFNIKNVLMFLQASFIKGEPYELIYPDWKIKVQDLCHKIKNKDICMVNLRSILHNLLISNINVELILEQILFHFLNTDKQLEALELFNKYTLRAQNGQKLIYHLEAFVTELIITI
jgi:replication factor C subunit 3/5